MESVFFVPSPMWVCWRVLPFASPRPHTHKTHCSIFFILSRSTLKRQKKKDHIFCPLTRQNTNKQKPQDLPPVFLVLQALRSLFLFPEDPQKVSASCFFPFLFSKTLSKGDWPSFFAFSSTPFLFVFSLAQSLPSSRSRTLSQLTKVFRIQQNHRHYQTFPHFPSCNPFSCFRVYAIFALVLLVFACFCFLPVSFFVGLLL